MSGVRPILLGLALLLALPAAAQPALPGLDPDAQVAVDAERLTWERAAVETERHLQDIIAGSA